VCGCFVFGVGLCLLVVVLVVLCCGGLMVVLCIVLVAWIGVWVGCLGLVC
jgi:hypothetical protein